MCAGLLEFLARLEVAAPARIERIGIRLYLDMPSDRSLAGIDQPDCQRTRLLRVGPGKCSEAPFPPAKLVPVSLRDPGRRLVRMAVLRPSPERLPEDHPCFPVCRRRRDMTVIVCPAAKDRVEQPYQALLVCAAILTNHTTYLLQKSVHVFSGGCNQELAVILAQVLPQEVEALFDMRDAGFLR